MGLSPTRTALLPTKKRRRTSSLDASCSASSFNSPFQSPSKHPETPSILRDSPSPESSRSIYDSNTVSSSDQRNYFLSDSSSSSTSSSSSSCSDSLLAAFAGELYSYFKKRQKKRRTRRKSFHCDASNFWELVSFRDIVKVLGPDKFKTSYRMSLPAFKLLLNDIRDILQRPIKAATEYRRRTVPPEIRLAITLRILGSGSCVDLVLAYHVEESTIRQIFRHTCDALTSRLRLKGFPKTFLAMKQISRRFQSSRKETNPLPGCVGALDGICIKIKKPQPCENPAMFYCRKGFYAIPVQALVDSDYIFRFCSAVCTGATHDALAFSVSGLKREIDRGALFSVFYIVGDDAYTLSNYVITPCSKSNADVDQDNFNFYQSSHRMHIEQAFGMLVARWRILRGGLQYSVKRSTTIICLLMKLHNFILEHDRSRSVIVYSLSEGERDALEADINQWCSGSREVAREFQNRPANNRCEHEGALEPVQQTSQCSKRDVLIDIVKRKGKERPSVQLFSYNASQDPF